MEHWWCSTVSSILSIFSLQVNASQKPCRPLQKPCEKLLSLIQHKCCHHLPSSLRFWGESFSVPSPALWGKAPCDYTKIMVQETVPGEHNRQSWGPKESWEYFHTLCSSCKEGNSNASSTSRSVAPKLYQDRNFSSADSSDEILQSMFVNKMRKDTPPPLLLGSEFVDDGLLVLVNMFPICNLPFQKHVECAYLQAVTTTSVKAFLNVRSNFTRTLISGHLTLVYCFISMCGITIKLGIF